MSKVTIQYKAMMTATAGFLRTAQIGEKVSDHDVRVKGFKMIDVLVGDQSISEYIKSANANASTAAELEKGIEQITNAVNRGGLIPVSDNATLRALREAVIKQCQSAVNGIIDDLTYIEKRAAHRNGMIYAGDLKSYTVRNMWNAVANRIDADRKKFEEAIRPSSDEANERINNLMQQNERLRKELDELKAGAKTPFYDSQNRCRLYVGNLDIKESDLNEVLCKINNEPSTAHIMTDTLETADDMATAIAEQLVKSKLMKFWDNINGGNEEAAQ